MGVIGTAVLLRGGGRYKYLLGCMCQPVPPGVVHQVMV
jgi:hypothetical protein